MKPSCNDKDFFALTDEEQTRILDILLEFIDQYIVGNIDIDQLMDLIENIEIPF